MKFEMKYILGLFMFAAIISANSLNAQCRTFVKNNCREAMGEYIPSENFNAAKLQPGDEAEVEMTFYGGEDYRLLVCSQELLGEVEFQLLDLEGNVLFNNVDKEMASHFDFKVGGTQNLMVRIKVSDNNSAALAPQGCVAIMLGSKVDN